MQKALELNGKKFMGQELKLDKARSKENSQEGKKGKSCFKLNFKRGSEKFMYFRNSFLTLRNVHFKKRWS